MKPPQDRTPYPKDPRSQPVDANTADGGYVYVQDGQGIVHVLPDGPHLHPKVLGGCQPALYAGDMVIKGGMVTELTNLSGTFQCDDEDGLRGVADQLKQQGLIVTPGAVRFFPPDGSRPVILE
jgi:hypothetical protein